MKQNGVMPNKKKAAADGKMRQGERDKKKSYLLKTELIYQRQNCRKRGPRSCLRHTLGAVPVSLNAFLMYSQSFLSQTRRDVAKVLNHNRDC